ncbi:alpha/beta fold hydrolase [Kitasatospora sp. NPDC097643]|uniref:alpha/beta fold hydrolase n=1 Tax=Kitasatospora sp. NPDC097643 TaxID=3157230 RepID=UPI0033336918
MTTTVETTRPQGRVAPAPLPGPHAVAVTDRTVHTDDGARLAVTLYHPAGAAESAGAGPVVVLAHGWAAGRTVWHEIAELLATAGHTVAAYDQRGHGSATLGSEPVGIERLGRDLGSVVDTVAPEGPVVVLGHSGGGFAALAWAARLFATDAPAARARLAGLVLAGTAAHGQDTPASEVRMMGAKPFARALRTPWLGRRLLGQTVGPTAAFEVRERNRRLFAACDRTVRAACFASTQGMDLRPGLGRVTAPAVVVSGSADKVVDPALSRVLADTLPEARFEEVAGAGHMLPLETPDRLARLVHALASESAGR